MTRATRPFPLMPQLMAGLITLLIALVSPAAPLAAQFPDQVTFPLIDAVIDNHLPRIATYQATYLQNHNRYFQALWSHADSVDENSNTAPDQLTVHPTDQVETFGDMWVTGGVRIGLGRLPLRFRIDVFNSPCGHGYVMTFETMRLGLVYTRTVVVGGGQCEAYRESGWQRFAPITLP